MINGSRDARAHLVMIPKAEVKAQNEDRSFVLFIKFGMSYFS